MSSHENYVGLCQILKGAGAAIDIEPGKDCVGVDAIQRIINALSANTR